jgi:hypothetical protein
VVAGLPGCAIVPRDPDALTKAVGSALCASRDPGLRESMQIYGRQPIAERVIRVYRRVLAAQPQR